jgi:hypothetical protein
MFAVYRSTGRENHKSRPQYYSKLLALASFLRAVEELDDRPDVLFVNDGPIPQDRLDAMHGHGELVCIDGGDARRSYRAAVSLATQRAAAAGLSPQDLVWFAEDDYLYTPGSLRHLLGAAGGVPHADYLFLHGFLALDTSSPRHRPSPLWQPLSRAATDVAVVDGVSWYRAMTTQSTFGVRVGVLEADRRLLRFVPWTGGAWDHASCLSYQGLQPFDWAHVRGELFPFSSWPPRQWPRAMWRGTFRGLANLRSMRRPENCRMVYAPDPQMILHMEEPACADGFDWPVLAEATRDWAAARGIPMGPRRTAPTP